MTLMLPRGPLIRRRRKKKALSSLSDLCVIIRQGPIQMNTLLLTSSQTCSLHYHSIKTAYLNRARAAAGAGAGAAARALRLSERRRSWRRAGTWRRRLMRRGGGGEGRVTGSALPIREVCAASKTGRNVAAQGLMNI